MASGKNFFGKKSFFQNIDFNKMCFNEIEDKKEKKISIFSDSVSHKIDYTAFGLPRDPRLWENIEVIAWLDWAANEFQLYSDSVTNFIRSFQVKTNL